MERNGLKSGAGTSTARGETARSGRVATPGSVTPKRSSAYDGAFQQHLIDNGIYPVLFELRDDGAASTGPANLEDLRERLRVRRPSLSPSHFDQGAFDDFQRKNHNADSERTVLSSVLPIICGTSRIANQENVTFSKLDSITADTTVRPQPDVYDGIPPGAIETRVRRDLAQKILPSAQEHLPAVPNFYIEVKGPSGNLGVAQKQACHNGAIGARAIHALQNYRVDEPLYDGNAYTITATYGFGVLRLYTTHLQWSKRARHQSTYHMTELDAYLLTGRVASFREGATALRNARDWAQEQRRSFVSLANARARMAEPLETSTSQAHSNHGVFVEEPRSNLETTAGHDGQSTIREFHNHVSDTDNPSTNFNGPNSTEFPVDDVPDPVSQDNEPTPESPTVPPIQPGDVEESLKRPVPTTDARRAKRSQRQDIRDDKICASE